jgi:alkanesulfonate monooxygenase SsuD/methylene tetrahydromethanopterin reductase-like flavin-dependent oxidoreductase (luciferase family)
MEYGITIPRGDIAEQPSPWKYLTNFTRESEQMGCTYCVIGDRLESGMDPFSVLTAIVEASGRMRLVTSVLILPPCGILSAAKQYAALDVLTGGRVIAGVGRIGKSV